MCLFHLLLCCLFYVVARNGEKINLILKITRNIFFQDFNHLVKFSNLMQKQLFIVCIYKNYFYF